MFNIHFSVLTNFVVFVYLDVFLQLNFVSMNNSHFFELLLCLMVIALTRHFKSHMKILASTLYHKSHNPGSHYQHIISNGIGLQKILKLLQNFSGKNRRSVSVAPQYSFFCLVIRHQYHFDTIAHFSAISYPSIQRHPFVFKTISIFEKIATWNIFGNFPVKHPCWSPF